MKENLIAAKTATHTADLVKGLLSTADFRLGTDIHPDPEFGKIPPLHVKSRLEKKTPTLYMVTYTPRRI